MAAPATTSRSTPSGRIIEDGHSSKIAFARDADASFWEKIVQAPGVDGGEPIDITNMHNLKWRTLVPRHLKTLTVFTVQCHYDPVFFSTGGVDNLINQPGAITHHFSDGSKLDFFGYMQKFIPAAVQEGDPPMCELTIVPTNYDPTNDVEADPVLTSVSGT